MTRHDIHLILSSLILTYDSLGTRFLSFFDELGDPTNLHRNPTHLHRHTAQVQRLLPTSTEKCASAWPPVGAQPGQWVLEHRTTHGIGAYANNRSYNSYRLNLLFSTSDYARVHVYSRAHTYKINHWTLH